MIKVVNEFKLTVPILHAQTDADLCMRVDLPLDRKTVENEDWATGPPGRRRPWAFGPLGLSGRRAVSGRGPRACF